MFSAKHGDERVCETLADKVTFDKDRVKIIIEVLLSNFSVRAVEDSVRDNLGEGLFSQNTRRFSLERAE